MFPAEEEVESFTSSTNSRNDDSSRSSRCEVCVNFTAHFFCKNTRQGIATAVGAVCVVGLILTTVISSSLNPWLPISFMSALFGSCMGLFCCNKPSPKQPRTEILRMHGDRDYFLDTVVTSSHRASVVSRAQTPQRTPSIKSISYPTTRFMFTAEHPHTPAMCRQAATIYQIAPSGSEVTSYPVIIAPPTYQQATCCYYDYGVV